MKHLRSKKEDPFFKFNRLYEKRDNGCWEWVGHKNIRGYGMQRFGSKAEFAHRKSYKLHRGEIPNGLCVLHKCDNPGCVNPDHLWLGTIQDNNLDCVRKDRHSKGEGRPGCKLKEKDVLEIRDLHQSGKLSAKEISIMFDLDWSYIYQILSKRKWKHI